MSLGVSAAATRPALARALGGLSRGDRDVLLLIAWAELSYEETAGALGIPVGTVRSRLNRARRKVRAALGDSNPCSKWSESVNTKNHLDDLRMLGELGRHLDQEPPVGGLVRQRERLLEAVAEGRPTRAHRPWPMARRPWLFGLAATGTAAVAAATAVAFSLASGGAADPRDTVIRGRAIAGDAPSIRSDIAPRADQFVFVETRQQYASCHLGEPVACKLDAASQRQVWLSADGTRDGRLVQRVDGRPTPSQIPGCQDGREIQRVPEKTPNGPGKRMVTITGPCRPIPADQSGLPADPERLRAHLYERYGTTVPGKRGARTSDDLVFEAVGALSRESFVPAKVRAALFAVARRIPGVTTDPNAVDPAGRRSINLAYVARETGLRTEYFFDPANYQYLGTRQVATRAVDGLAKGEVIGSAAIWRLTVVDAAGRLPD